jgi:hypothetical protein
MDINLIDPLSPLSHWSIKFVPEWNTLFSKDKLIYICNGWISMFSKALFFYYVYTITSLLNIFLILSFFFIQTNTKFSILFNTFLYVSILFNTFLYFSILFYTFLHHFNIYPTNKLEQRDRIIVRIFYLLKPSICLNWIIWMWFF